MKPTMNTVALRIAVMMTRSKKARATLLGKELQMLAETTVRLPAKSFIQLRNNLDDYGYVIAEATKEKTFVVLKISALDGASPVVPTSSRVIKDLALKTDRELFDELGLPYNESEEE